MAMHGRRHAQVQIQPCGIIRRQRGCEDSRQNEAAQQQKPGCGERLAANERDDAG
jgi:hypothetical protein